MENNHGCSIGSMPCVLLTIVFLLLKVFDKIDWSYWLVFSPLWIPIAFVLAILALYFVFSLLIMIVQITWEFFEKRRRI